MSDRQAQIRVARALLGSWPSQVAGWGEEAIAAYLEELEARGVTAERALVAIRSCPENQAFPPSAAQLAGLARRNPDEPTFPELLEAIYAADGVLRPRTGRAQAMRARIAACVRGCDDGWVYDEAANANRPCECRGVAEPVTDEMRLARADELHPLIGGFVRAHGLPHLSRLNPDDSQWGEANRRRLKDEWEEFCDREDARDVAQLVVGGRRGELVQFHPGAMLERRTA